MRTWPGLAFLAEGARVAPAEGDLDLHPPAPKDTDRDRHGPAPTRRLEHRTAALATELCLETGSRVSGPAARKLINGEGAADPDVVSTTTDGPDNDSAIADVPLICRKSGVLTRRCAPTPPSLGWLSKELMFGTLTRRATASSSVLGMLIRRVTEGSGELLRRRGEALSWTLPTTLGMGAACQEGCCTGGVLPGASAFGI